ncbi:hypothetical protein [Mesomycoplasma dispar]|uniref:hypothetical protein n=1 Tax=Mesomycoplasma dispar TaxID=86660 RepID=UPI001E2877C9|nr:hypothetical protein [Mesomycoplasma dispar]
MNKNKTLRFYLTQICEEFHKEKDCYYRLKFAKETVGIFKSLADVVFKIEDVKNPVRLWVLRNNKFENVISFPLPINIRTLSPAQRDEYLAKLFAEDSEIKTSKSSDVADKIKKNDTINQQVVSRSDNSLVFEKNKKKQPKTELVITEDEKTVDEILYALTQNETDLPIDCPVCDKYNEDETASHECPCHLIELEISDPNENDFGIENKNAFQPEQSSESFSFETVDFDNKSEVDQFLVDSETKNDEAIAKKDFEFTANFKNNQETILEQKTNDEDRTEKEKNDNYEEIDNEDKFEEITKLEKEKKKESIFPEDLVFNQEISDEFDKQVLEKVKYRTQILIKKGQEKEFEEESKLKTPVIEGEILDGNDLENDYENHHDNLSDSHTEFCDSPVSSSFSKSPCSACAHNGSCPWCQKYRNYLLEAKDCPACLARFKEQNFDYLGKIHELRSTSFVAKKLTKVPSQICKTCTHNALCSWCQRYRTYLLEAKNCGGCKELLRAKNIDLDRKIFELSHPSYPSFLLKNKYFSNCKACNHNASCPWCQKYRIYLQEAKDCPACLARFKEQNFDVDAKLLELRFDSYSKNLPIIRSKISCSACFHNVSCQWCQKYATYLLEAKNCPACLARFKEQNFDYEQKLAELRVNNYSDLYSLVWQQTYNSPCATCNHNFFCPKCRKLAAYYREARKCSACKELLRAKNIDIEEKIYQLSYYPYFESRALVTHQFLEQQKLAYNANCASCSHVYFCKFCQKYRAFLLEAKNCPACRYLFAQKNLSIDYLLKIINYEFHSDDFNHINPLLVLAHGKTIAHETIPEIVEIPQVVEVVLDYSWIKIYHCPAGITNYPLNKFPALIPLFQGIVYQALLGLNWADHNSIVDDELFNTKRGYGGYNVQSGLSVGLGDLSVDEATRVIAASTSSVDDDEEIIIVATEKSTIWGLPSYVLWFVLFAVIAVLIIVIVMFVLHGVGII